MAMVNPRAGRTTEPNSWSAQKADRARIPSAPSFRSFSRRRRRDSASEVELFADHYSQAAVYLSQTEVETHIKMPSPSSSPRSTLVIRARMVTHLRNVDEALAQGVADGLGLVVLPDAAEPARPVVTDLAPSPAWSASSRTGRRALPVPGKSGCWSATGSTPASSRRSSRPPNPKARRSSSSPRRSEAWTVGSRFQKRSLRQARRTLGRGVAVERDEALVEVVTPALSSSGVRRLGIAR